MCAHVDLNISINRQACMSHPASLSIGTFGLKGLKRPTCSPPKHSKNVWKLSPPSWLRVINKSIRENVWQDIFMPDVWQHIFMPLLLSYCAYMHAYIRL